MKILIQHNFRTGIGDMYNDMVEYMTTLKKYKQMGYEIHLIYCLFNNKYINKKIFHEIFDDSTIEFFDSVQESFEPITEVTYKKFNYVLSAHNPQKPGIHRWDLFSDCDIKGIQPFRIPANLFVTEFDKIVKPNFQKKYIDSAENFTKQFNNGYNFIHIRTMDSEKNENKYNFLKNKFIELLDNHSNEVFHLGTNNKFLNDSLHGIDNVKTFPFKHIDMIDNELNGAFNKNVGSELLQERFIENIIEMISIRYVNKIYSYSDYGWVSLFLLYGIIEGNINEKNYIRINFNNG